MISYWLIYAVTFVFILIIGFTLGALSTRTSKRHPPRDLLPVLPGAIYYQGEPGNPFHERLGTPKVRVQEVKDGFVLFYYLNSGSTHRLRAMRIAEFVAVYTLEK